MSSCNYSFFLNRQKCWSIIDSEWFHNMQNNFINVQKCSETTIENRIEFEKENSDLRNIFLKTADKIDAC